MRAVDVGDKVELHALLAVGLESLADHDRAQVGATDTDVDDGVDRLAAVALPLAAPDLLGELLHVVEHAVDLLHYALPIHLHRVILGVPEGDMVHGSVLGEVDLLTLEHVISELLDVGLLGQLDQQWQSVLSEEVLAEVEEDLGTLGVVLEGAGEFLEALRVLLELGLQNHTTTELVVVVHQGLPCWELVGLREARHGCGCLTGRSGKWKRTVAGVGHGRLEVRNGD